MFIGGVLNPDGSVIKVSISNKPNTPCVITPHFTVTDFFVDEGLNRSDIRADTHTGTPKTGALIQIQFCVTFLSAEGECFPCHGAVVDLWHCDAVGIYSDLPAQGTTGQNFLRGSQITDVGGRVGFTTIFPGWSEGRAVHMDVLIRSRKPLGEATPLEFMTQIFFDDSVTDMI